MEELDTPRVLRTIREAAYCGMQQVFKPCTTLVDREFIQWTMTGRVAPFLSVL